MDKVKAKSEFLEKISKLDRGAINDILHKNSKPVKKLIVLSLIKNIGPQEEQEAYNGT